MKISGIMMTKHIWLTGFMGAGKSRIGRKLSENLGRHFFDIDNLIEKEQKRTIPDIFEKDGESWFRKLESEKMRQIVARTEAGIIALGGGALNDPENLRLVMDNGLLVYIKSSPQAIYERVRHSNKRPLLTPGKKEDVLRRIEELLSKRRGTYEQADIIFNRDGMEWDEAAGLLVDKILNHMKE